MSESASLQYLSEEHQEWGKFSFSQGGSII